MNSHAPFSKNVIILNRTVKTKDLKSIKMLFVLIQEIKLYQKADKTDNSLNEGTKFLFLFINYKIKTFRLF